jgi:hypothetical protein
MSTTPELLAAISKKFDLLSAGQPDIATERAMWQQLAQDFSDLSVAMAASAGWGPPTGVADRTTFDTATVTTTNLAKRLKALIDDLTTKGILGP